MTAKIAVFPGFLGVAFHSFESGNDLNGIIVEQAGLARLNPLAPLALSGMDLSDPRFEQDLHQLQFLMYLNDQSY